MNNQRKAWDTIAMVLSSPMVYLTTLSTALLVIMSSVEGKSTQENLLLAILLSLSAAVWGGKLSGMWQEYHDAAEIRRRGKQSLRMTSFMLEAVKKLQIRVQRVYSDHKENSLSAEAVRIHLEEFVSLCQFLREQGVNAAAIWDDVYPEADYEAQLREIADLYSAVRHSKREIETLSCDLTEARKLKVGLETQEKLTKSREEEVKQLRAHEKALLEKVAYFDHSLASMLYTHCDRDSHQSILRTLQESEGGEPPVHSSWTRIIELSDESELPQVNGSAQGDILSRQ